MKKVGKRAALALLLAAVATIAIEGAHRVWLLVAGRPYDAAETAAEVREIATPWWTPAGLDDGVGSAAGQVLHPYLGFDDPGAHERIQEDLARQREAANGHYDIVVIGSAAATALLTLESEITAQLARAPRLADKTIRLLPYAHPEHKQPQQLLLVSYLLSAGLEPHAVLNIDGLQEIVGSDANHARGLHPVYPAADRWLPLATRGPSGVVNMPELSRLALWHEEIVDAAASVLARGSCVSSVLGTWALADLRDRRAEFRRKDDAYRSRRAASGPSTELLGPGFDGNREDAVRAGVRAWFESSVALAAQCRRRSIFYFHALQPAPRPESPPAKTDRPGHAARFGYPLLRSAGQELGARGVAFLDCSLLFEGGPDESSLSRRGARARLADAIVAGFVARLR